MTRGRGIRRRRNEAFEYYVEHMHDAVKGCMHWPYNMDKDGYPVVWIPGQKGYKRLTVLACALWNGPMPEPGMVAAHGECHDVGCWNGQHLSWKTHHENAQDRWRDGSTLHGEANHRAKLTTTEVLEIRQIYGTGLITQAQLAARYGVSSKAVSKIIRRQRWPHI